MSAVTELQRGLAQHLRDPQGTPSPPGIEERRLQIYRDLVYRNIKGFIDSTFPVLCSLHSDEEWEVLVREFVREHRCHSPLFLEISEEFITFLSQRESDPQRPFMLELAHYEWLELAVDVAEGEVPPVTETEDPQRVRAELAPTARLGSYQFAVHRIGPSFQPTETEAPVNLLVYRDREDRVQFMELSAGAARLIYESSQEPTDVSGSGGPESDVAGGESVHALLLRLAQEWGMEAEGTLAFGWEQFQAFSAAGAIALLPKGVE